MIWLQVVKSRFNKWINKVPQLHWKTAEKCNHSKKFQPSNFTKLTGQGLSLDRKQINLLIEYLTGHCRLKARLHKLKVPPDGMCCMCYTEEVTGTYILSTFERFDGLRHQFCKHTFENYNLMLVLWEENQCLLTI